MTILVLLVLVVVWGVVLFSWLRSRVQASFGDPVGSFRRHLTVLENAGPNGVRSVNRMRIGGSLPAQLTPTAGSRRAPLNFHPVQLDRQRPGSRGAVRPVGRPGPSSASLRRRQTLKRRRDILFALVAVAVGTLLLGLVPGLHSLLLLNLIVDLLLGAYISLLVRLRNLALERDRKLAYLPRSGPADLARAASARGATRATPARAAQAARDRRWAGGIDRLGGYEPRRHGEVAMRRVLAN